MPGGFLALPRPQPTAAWGSLVLPAVASDGAEAAGPRVPWQGDRSPCLVRTQAAASPPAQGLTVCVSWAQACARMGLFLLSRPRGLAGDVCLLK